jgi:hypothetical protein
MINREQILQEFPEARESDSSGHLEYYVHCRKPHKKGGLYKMSINSETGVYYCHDCGATGNIQNDYLDITSHFLSLSTKREQPSIAPPPRRKMKQWKDDIPTPGEMVGIEELDKEHPALIYMAKRGVTQEELQANGVMYCLSGQFRFSNGLGTTSGRIIFPVFMNSILVGWQARLIDAFTPKGRKGVWHGENHGWTYPSKTEDGSWSDFAVPKYYTCPGMKRHSSIYGFDKAIAEGRDLVVVTEGPVDCIKVGKKSVCTFGSKITNQQSRILRSNWDTIVWILDEDIDTESNWFNGLSSDLSTGATLHWMKMTGAKDPGDCTTEEIWSQIHNKLNIKP